MLFKKDNECLITEVPRRSFPVDGALGMKEIVDVVTEQDIIVQHSVLLDEGELTSQEESNLKQPIREECAHNTATLRRVKQTRVSAEQVATLEEGGVVFLPESSTRGCNVMVNFVFLSKLLFVCLNPRLPSPIHQQPQVGIGQTQAPRTA